MTPRSRSLAGLALLLAGCSRAASGRDLPDADAFHRHVLAVAATYPTDGTHRYWWPKEGAWKGNVRTLSYAGEVIAPGDSEGRCFCCGLTFEVFLQAWERWCVEEGRPFRILGFAATDVSRIQREWFGSPADPSCLHTAIVSNGLGRRIGRWRDAEAGDFVQLWRHNGSGHSVVFLRWAREEGRITGITYWSTQSSTQGIAEHTESFGDSGGSLDASRLWICRVGA